MCVQVDETGKQDTVWEVVATICGGGVYLGGARCFDRNNPAVANRDLSGAVDTGTCADDATSADDQVEMRMGLLHH